MIYKWYLDYNLDNMEMAFWNRIYYAAPEFMKEEIVETTGNSKTRFINDLSTIMKEGIEKVATHSRDFSRELVATDVMQ